MRESRTSGSARGAGRNVRIYRDSKVKAGLRAIKARTQEALENAVQAVVRTVTSQDAAGWFTHSDTFLIRNKLVSVPIIGGDA